MQTILGAGGAIGKDLAKELKIYTDKIRLVSRSPKRINETDELISADLLNPQQVQDAVKESDVVYLCVGLPYKISVWKVKWPIVIKNVIEACRMHNAKLVFFDNMYMYDKDHLANMDENTPVNPSSKKGKVRAAIAQQIMDAVEKGEIKALIARAPDFLGSHNSVIYEMVYKNLKKGKSAMWFADVTKIKNVIFTPDAARATAMLGNEDDTFNQIWHLPSTHEKLTGKDWIELFANKMGVKPKYTVLKPGILSLLGIFIPVMREFKEMIYQYDRDYFFNSSKFEKRFGFTPTSADEAVDVIVKEFV